MKYYAIPGLLSMLILLSSLQSTLAILPADGNGDGKADGLDYVIWFKNYNQSVANGAAGGDFNNDGKADGLDYVIWFNNYGKSGSGPTITTGPTLPPTGNKITYTASTEDVANPERGFMKQSSIYVDQPFDPNKVRALQPSDTLVWIYFRLDNYRDPRDGPGIRLTDYQGKLLEPLGSGKGLDTIKATFSEARQKGLKLVIRFIYNFGPDWTPDPMQANPDMPLDWVLQHINQLKPLIVENMDVMLTLQIGFVGHWGEWHSSKYLTSLTGLKTIVETLLNIVPQERMLQIRYPSFKEMFFPGVLPESEAFTGSAKSRIGHHNDCFLRGQDDTTYKSTRSGFTSNYCAGQDEIACWKNFIATEGRFTPVGGETCEYNPPRSECNNALSELEMLHWSFINNDYRPEVLNSWTSGGCMPEIRRRLGYRLELIEAFIPSQVKAGTNFNLNVKLKNVGFASLFNPRPLYLVLLGANRYEIPLANVDPRRFEPGKDQTISVNVNLPQNISAGIYKLGLWLPDAYASLKNNPRFSVRFANTNTWDPTTGINILTSNFQIIP